MHKIDGRKELRTRFMNELFNMAEGSQGNYVRTQEIAQELGLSFSRRRRKERQEIVDAARYLKGEGLIDVLGDESGQVRLTHQGIREVETAKSQPDEPTYHFAPINVVYARGDIINSQMQQGSPGATQAITRLRADKDSLAEWFGRRYGDAERIVKDSVSANTFRAFAHMPHPPSRVFRCWASRRLNDDGVVREIADLRSESDYDLWLKEFSRDLSDYRRRKMGSEKRMPYGPGRKLPNLLMKHVVLWSSLDDEQRARLVIFLHIPFDKYSLSLVRNCVPERYRPVVGRIRKDVTIKFVDSEARYDALMALSRDIARKTNVQPIYLDVLAWKQTHT